MRIHHDDVAAIGVQTVHCDGELALADILEGVIDGEDDRCAGLRLIGPRVGRVQSPAIAVARQSHLARVTAQQRVEGQLESSQWISLAIETAKDTSDAA